MPTAIEFIRAFVETLTPTQRVAAVLAFPFAAMLAVAVTLTIVNIIRNATTITRR